MNWDCTRLVKECVSQRHDPIMPGILFLGDFVTPSQRLRLKKVYVELTKMASIGDKKYFSCDKCPDDGDGRSAWLARIEDRGHTHKTLPS